MAKQGDGWPSKEMGGLVERWVAKQKDGWLREMGGQVSEMVG
jgi:hypothetical protein